MEQLTTLIAVSDIRPSKTNPRKHFNEAELEELAESIRSKGVLQPVLLRPGNGSGAGYELVAGERRWRAAKAAQLDRIPAMVREFTDAEVLEVQVIENLQRTDLHPLEEAEGYEQLMKLHGYVVEELAAKVGKSKGYVYARLKLTALVPEARKAFYDGKLNPSTALLIARIPVPELQKKVVGEITHDGNWGGPMSVRQAADHLQREYMLRLAEAPWPVADAQLLPKAGACTTCPKRTGNQRELFGDVKSADVCTDPKCFEEKKAAWQEKVRAEAEASGRTVISGAQAKKIVPYEHSSRLEGGYVDLNDRCYDDPKSRNYRALLGKAAGEAVLLEDPHTGNLRDVMPRAAVTKALKEKGYAFTKAKPSGTGLGAGRQSKKERQKEELKAKIEERAENLTWAAVGTAVERLGPKPEVLRFLASSSIQRMDWGLPEELLKARYGIDHFGSHDKLKALVAKMKPGQLVAFVLEHHLAGFSGEGADVSLLRDASKAFRVDPKKLLAEAAAQIEAEEQKAAVTEKKAPAKPKAKKAASEKVKAKK